MADTDVKAWLNGAQQLFDGPQDISEETPTTTGGLSDGSMAFFVGKPKTDGSGEWILKKVTPGNLNKMVFNYLTQSNIASQLASVLGVFKFGGSAATDANTLTENGFYLIIATAENTPSTQAAGYWLILVFRTGASIEQVAIHRNAGEQKIRMLNSNTGSWSEWV